MLGTIIAVLVGVVIGWNTTKPAFVVSLEGKVKSLLAKKAEQMKTFLLIPLLFLSACSFVMPRPHDPVMFGYLVDVKVGMSKISCEDKTVWKPIQDRIETLKVYAELRNDPQVESIAKLQEAVNKAQDTKSYAFCESIIRLNKTRVDVVADAWRGR